MGLISFLAFQTLPPPLRRLYGVRGGRAAGLAASLAGLRVGRPLAPPRVRFVAPAVKAGWRLEGRYGSLAEAAAHWPRGSARVTVCYRGIAAAPLPVDG